MKNKFTFLFILISMTQFAQTKTEFDGENVKVSFGKNIESEKVSIRLGQGTWNVTLFPLFENNQIVKNAFPKEAGIYNLIINYSNDLYYNEIVLYRMSPKSEELSFDFYQDSGKIFCRIKSDYAQELNKEVVMNKFDKEMQEIINSVKE
jgi:hypothetical protein